ncbi:FMN-binding protein [Nocardioides sp.]|jgi:uncharacterized protein with FMN-binding domain|uniref:FMN-binding protein n=1 Tax=Nocardioides sp. TaxID=35761 RepID=UPI002C79732C|nr:FMN-binding protein [Nocardioides sp.]HVX54995.1 FMN-binding protein [Nocardioides sp.]
MNRIVFWLLATVAVVVLLFGYHTSTSGPEASATPPAVISAPKSAGATSTPSQQASQQPSDQPSDQPTQGATSAPNATTGGEAATSTVIGAVAETQWGPVQVELSIAGGKISDVEVVQYPHGNGRDMQINTYALPQLIQETLAAQSAQIDMVSGATITSDGYLRSLQSALDKAGL